MLQSPLSLYTPPQTPPLSGVHLHFLLVLVPTLLPGPCFFSPPPTSVEPLPKPSKCTHHGAGEGSVGSSTPPPLWGPAASPGTQTPGSQGELHPVLAAGEAQPVIGMSHPLARQPGGWREEGKEREGGKEGRGAGGKPQATSGVGLGPGA